MKKIFFLIFLFTSITFAQEQQLGGMFEIYTQVIGGGDFHRATFELTAINSVWLQDGTNNLPITNDYNYAVAYDKYCESIFIPSNSSSNDQFGIYHTVSSQICNNNTFANGLYKLNITGYYDNSIIDNYILFLDYRTDNYPQNSNNDIWIEYNVLDNSVRIKWNSLTGFEDTNEFTVYRIAIQKNIGFVTSKFTNFWNNSLTILPELNSNNPYLVWGPYPGNSITSYKIYRGIPNPIKPRIFNYSLVATVGNDVFEYSDYDIFLDPNGDEVRYYITAVVNGSESTPSNTVSTNGGLYKESPPPPRSIV